jgi:hypothetical protein
LYSDLDADCFPERNIILPLDPIPSGRGIFTYEAQTSLFTVSFPYSFIADLLIAFYWQSLLGRSKGNLSKAVVGLNKWRIPFAIISVALIVTEHTSSALRAERENTAVVTVYAILLCIAMIGIGSFFLYTGVKVIKLLTSASTLTGTERSSRVTFRVQNNTV